MTRGLAAAAVSGYDVPSPTPPLEDGDVVVVAVEVVAPVVVFEVRL